MNEPAAILRITRQSNDWVTWIVLPISIVCLMFLSVVSAMFWRLVGLSSPLTWIALAFSAFFFCASLILFRRLVAPFEFEFVLDETGIRYGRSNRPAAQKVVSREQILEFLYDPDDGSLSMFVGTHEIAPPLAPDILLTKASQQNVVDAVTRHWPEVKIVLYGAQPAAR